MRKEMPTGTVRRTANSGFKIPILNTCASDGREPFRTLGKPEPLGGNLAGWCPRRINREHWLVYRITAKGEAQALEAPQCRYHC